MPHPVLMVGGWRESCCFYRLADLVVEHHIEEPGCWSLDLNWNPIFIISHVTFLKFLNISKNWLPWGFPVAQMVKNLPAMQETQVQSLGREDVPGKGNGNPRQYSCLENPKDRGAWQAIVHRVTKNQT